MRRNNNVRIHGQLAQETVEVVALEPQIMVRVAVDTDKLDRGGRHWVLFEGQHRADELAAHLAASAMAGTPLVVIVIGQLLHERGRSMVVNMTDVSYSTFWQVRKQVEELQRQGGLHLARGPVHPLRSSGYHTCIYVGGALDLRTLGAREHTGADNGVAVTATLDTGEQLAQGRHELMLPARGAQTSLLALRSNARGVSEIEANVCGTLYTENGYTRVVVLGIELPELVAQEA